MSDVERRGEASLPTDAPQKRAFSSHTEGVVPLRPQIRALPASAVPDVTRPRRVVSLHSVRSPREKVDPVTLNGPVTVRYVEPKLRPSTDEPTKVEEGQIPDIHVDSVSNGEPTAVYTSVISENPSVSGEVTQNVHIPSKVSSGHSMGMSDNEFLATFEASKSHLYSVGMRMFGNHDDAAELVQETFARAWKSRDSYRQGNFEGWLHRISTNTGISTLRRMQRAPGLHQASVDGEVPEKGVVNVKGDHDPAELASTRDLVHGALSDPDLPTAFAEAVYLVDVVGLTHKEAAVAIGEKFGTMQSRVFRGRKHLRSTMEQKEEE